MCKNKISKTFQMTSPVLLVVHPDDRTPEVSSSWGHFRAFPSELGAKEAWIHPAKPAPLYPPTQFWLPASQIPENEVNKTLTYVVLLI